MTAVTSSYLVPVAQLLREIPSSMEVAFEAPFDEQHEFIPRPRGESDVPLDAAVSVALRLEAFRGGLRAKGVVGAPWQAECRRCSKLVEGYNEIAVNERFVDNPPPDDEEAYPIDGDFIDLAHLVHYAVFLELPLAPLCREDCQGLCSECGIDKNEANCDCRPSMDPRWATLDALRLLDVSSERSDEE